MAGPISRLCPVINTKHFYSSQKECDTQKVARVNGLGKTKGKWQDQGSAGGRTPFAPAGGTNS